MSLRERWLAHRRNRKRPRPAIVIQTIEAQWPEGYVPLSRRDPERYESQKAKILANLRPGHAVSCEPECDGTDRYCKCSSIGPCWHHR